MKITFECASVAEIEELRVYLNEKAGRREETAAAKGFAGEAAENRPGEITLEDMIDEYVNFPDERREKKFDPDERRERMTGKKEDGEA